MGEGPQRSKKKGRVGDMALAGSTSCPWVILRYVHGDAQIPGDCVAAGAPAPVVSSAKPSSGMWKRPLATTAAGMEACKRAGWWLWIGR